LLLPFVNFSNGRAIHFYKERTETLATDARALALYRKVTETQQKVRTAVSSFFKSGGKWCLEEATFLK
jgi:hypothetical protein